METQIDLKNQILEKAEERFIHYGFNKTTMAEIAKDCQMSAANLYRYFENKEEIGVNIAQKCMQKAEETVEGILNNSGLSASKMLEEVILCILEYHASELCNRPKILELVEFVTNHRGDVLKAHHAKKTALIAEILAKGNSTGEFEIKDIIETANCFMIATMRFWSISRSSIFKSEPIEKVRESASSVVRLIISGLKKR